MPKAKICSRFSQLLILFIGVLESAALAQVSAPTCEVERLPVKASHGVTFANQTVVWSELFEGIAFNLFGLDIDSREIIRLSSMPVNEAYPFISRDDRWVVFTRDFNSSQDLVLMDLSTGDEILIAEHLGPGSTILPDVSADGGRVVFSSDDDIISGQNTDRSEEIFLFDRSLGILEQITMSPFDSSIGELRHPRLDDTGSAVYFSTGQDLVPGSNLDFSREIFRMDLATRSISQLTHVSGEESGSIAPYALVSGSGSHLLFRSRASHGGLNPTGNFRVFLMDLASGEIRRITDSNGSLVALSTDGSVALLGLSSGGGTTGLYDAASGQLGIISDSVFASDIFGGMSADGTQVVFTEDTDVYLGKCAIPDSDLRVTQELLEPPTGVNSDLKYAITVENLSEFSAGEVRLTHQTQNSRLASP